MSDYRPDPLPTDSVVLPPELLDLVEDLAENAHENWAEQRMADGWVYGARRSDEAKTHPCLVAYSELPEDEKEYDRRTALQTLKATVMLGFRIDKDD